MAESVTEEALAIRRKIIAVLLQGARLKSGKSKKDCAAALGVTAGAYAAYEDGRRDLSLPELELLANYLNVPIGGFFDNTDRLVEEEPPVPREQVVELRQRIVGALLRKARVDKNVSQKDLAEHIGISPRRMTEYEFGQKPIPVSHLQEMADALDVPMSYFVDEGIGTIGEHELVRSQFDKFSDLPEDVRRFIVNPTNISYLRVAQRLSDMTTQQLRNIAAAILDITY
jgi:transcriptional regulator with XRE-family HTH domain